MRSIRLIARLSAAVIALSLASVAAAPAQSTGPSTTRSPIRAPNQPSVDRALREFGFDPYRLRAEQQRALDSTWGLLYPGVSQYRTTLNSSQATALVYVALVHGRRGTGGRDDYGRGGWGRDDYGRDRNNGGDGWNDDRNGRGDDRNSRGGAQCVELNQRLYDAQNELGSDARSNYVSAAQKGPVRESLRDVQRVAVERGWRRAADLASEAMMLLNDNFPVRASVLQRIQAIKGVVDESCGQDRERRY